MKFSDIRRDQWEEWKPFLDTCIVPLTGLTGEENPWQAADKLEELRDVLDAVEAPFTGRVVVYPAIQYADCDLPGAFVKYVDGVCASLKKSGFKHVLVATSVPAIADMNYSAADAVVGPHNIQDVRTLIASLWNKIN